MFDQVLTATAPVMPVPAISFAPNCSSLNVAGLQAGIATGNVPVVDKTMEVVLCGRRYVQIDKKLEVVDSRIMRAWITEFTSKGKTHYRFIPDAEVGVPNAAFLLISIDAIGKDTGSLAKIAGNPKIVLEGRANGETTLAGYKALMKMYEGDKVFVGFPQGNSYVVEVRDGVTVIDESAKAAPKIADKVVVKETAKAAPKVTAPAPVCSTPCVFDLLRKEATTTLARGYMNSYKEDNAAKRASVYHRLLDFSTKNEASWAAVAAILICHAQDLPVPVRDKVSVLCSKYSGMPASHKLRIALAVQAKREEKATVQN